MLLLKNNTFNDYVMRLNPYIFILFSVRSFSCAFLDPSGKIFQIFVPIHALTDKSSSHDSNLQAKLKELLDLDNVESEALIQLVKSGKYYDI